MEGRAERQRHHRLPYQLISTTVASKPAIVSAVARPSGVPLAWTTRSASADACYGSAKRQPSAAAITWRVGIDVDQLDLGAR